MRENMVLDLYSKQPIFCSNFPLYLWYVNYILSNFKVILNVPSKIGNELKYYVKCCIFNPRLPHLRQILVQKNKIPPWLWKFYTRVLKSKFSSKICMKRIVLFLFCFWSIFHRLTLIKTKNKILKNPTLSLFNIYGKMLSSKLN